MYCGVHTAYLFTGALRFNQKAVVGRLVENVRRPRLHDLLNHSGGVFLNGSYPRKYPSTYAPAGMAGARKKSTKETFD